MELARHAAQPRPAACDREVKSRLLERCASRNVLDTYGRGTIWRDDDDR